MGKKRYLGNGIDPNRVYRDMETGDCIREFADPDTLEPGQRERWLHTMSICRDMEYMADHPWKFFRIPIPILFPFVEGKSGGTSALIHKSDIIPFKTRPECWTKGQQEQVRNALKEISSEDNKDYVITDPNLSNFAFKGRDLFYIDHGSLSKRTDVNIHMRDHVLDTLVRDDMIFVEAKRDRLSKKFGEWKCYGSGSTQVISAHEMEFVKGCLADVHERKRTLTVVDVGSGKSPFLPLLTERNASFDWLAMDGCPEVLDATRTSIDVPAGSTWNPMCLDLLKDPWPTCYDADSKTMRCVMWNPADVVILSSISHHLMRGGMTVKDMFDRLSLMTAKESVILFEYVSPRDSFLGRWTFGDHYPVNELSFLELVPHDYSMTSRVRKGERTWFAFRRNK